MRVTAARLTASNIATTGATLTIAHRTGQWWYQQQGDPACTSVVTTTTPLTGLTPNTSYTYTAYRAEGCTSANEIATVAFTTPQGHPDCQQHHHHRRNLDPDQLAQCLVV